MMTLKQKTAWATVEEWLIDFIQDKSPWEKIPAADLLQIMYEATSPEHPSPTSFKEPWDSNSIEHNCNCSMCDAARAAKS